MTVPTRPSNGQCTTRLRKGGMVLVNRGPLAGMRGVLVDFQGDRRCVVQLGVRPGVLLVIPTVAVREGPRAPT